MYTPLTAALALASTVSATAISSTKWYSLRQVARVSRATEAELRHTILTNPQFDNDISVPLTGAAPINEYLDIFWNGMSLVNTVSVAGANPGVAPNSPPNYAAYSVGTCYVSAFQAINAAPQRRNLPSPFTNAQSPQATPPPSFKASPP